MKKINTLPSAFPICLYLILLLLNGGCRYYYEIQTFDRTTPEEIRDFRANEKYFILHTADTAWHLNNLTLTDNSFYGTLSALPQVHLKYRTENGKYRYRRSDVKGTSIVNESEILKEVHLYYSGDDLIVAGDGVTGNLSSVQKVDVYSKNKGKTAWSWIWPPLVIPSAMIVLFAVIVTAIS